MTLRTRRRSLAVVLLVVAAGCGRDAMQPEPDVSVVEQPPAPLAPLTGLPLEDPAVADRAVVATKIDNLTAAGPQAGLEAADLVFEEVVEGGITRFLALFHSRVPERVGPIRSARPEDAAILPPFGAVLFISGARPDVLQSLHGAGVEVREEDGRTLRRDPSRRPPHNVFANGTDLFGAAGSARPGENSIGWTFDALPPPGEMVCAPPCAEPPGNSITVNISQASAAGFRYDHAGGYQRLQGGRPHPGTASIANIVVLGTQISPAGCCDPAGNPLSATQVVGTGRALVLRDGRRYAGRWSKSSGSQHLAVTRPDGTFLPLKPGPTWVLLAPASALPPSP